MNILTGDHFSPSTMPCQCPVCYFSHIIVCVDKWRDNALARNGRTPVWYFGFELLLRHFMFLAWRLTNTRYRLNKDREPLKLGVSMPGSTLFLFHSSYWQVMSILYSLQCRIAYTWPFLQSKSWFFFRYFICTMYLVTNLIKV